MLIGIDGNEANTKDIVGVGRYSYELIKSIYYSCLKNRKQDLQFRIYLEKKPLPDLPKENSWWKYHIFGTAGFWVVKNLVPRLWQEKIKKRAPDIFWSPTHYAPFPCPIPSVISIMDMSFIRYPNLFTKKDFFQLKTWTAISAKKASKIFTISNFSKREIIEHYQFPENKVIVTYPGYDNKKFNIGRIDGIRKKYRIGSEYLLFVGTLQPRKNIVRLIEAFNLLKNINLALIITGKKGWIYEDIFSKVKELDLGKRIRYIDYIKENDLPNLYQSAKCLVLPSLYEGFGLPVVEAMACGCPVVASNNSSLPEIIGDAGILVNPLNVADIARGITTALDNQSVRNQLIEKGLARVKRFNWATCAQNTLEVLKRVKSDII